MVEPHAHPGETAIVAMRHWAAGAASGDWSALLAMLHPEVTFHVPVAGFPGLREGVAEATRFFEHLAAVVRADLRVTSTMHGRDRTGFEVAVQGTMRGRPFAQALCLVFVLADGRVRQFREYLAWPGGLEARPSGLDLTATP